MRLPWLSRRSAGRSTGGAAAPAAGGAVQPAAPPVGRSEWREVGTLRPSFRADPGIRVQRFRDDLAGSHPPDPILRPLGHERSADGPAGLVSGLTRPVVARVVAGPRGTLSLPLAHRKSPTATAALDTTAVERGPVEPVEAGQAEADGLPSIEPRHVPAVAIPIPGRHLTVAPVPVGPPTAAAGQPPSAPGSPAVQRTTAPLVAHTTGLTLAPAAPSITGAGRSPAGDAAPPAMRTILRSPSGARTRLGPPISRSADGTLSDLPAPTTRTGAASPSTSAHEVATPLVRPDAPIAGGLSTTVPAGPVASHEGTTAVGSPTWSAPFGLVLARVVATPEPLVPKTTATSGAGRAVAAAPVVSARPLSPTSWPPAAARGAAGAPRSTAIAGHAHTGGTSPTGVAPRARSSPPVTSDPGGGATTQRASRSDAISPMVQRLDAVASPTEGGHRPGQMGNASPVGRGTTSSATPSTVPVPGRIRGMTVGGRVTIPTAAGPLHSGAGRAVLAHELVHVQQQRALGGAMPAPGSESAHRLESAARSAEAAVGWEEMTLARPGARSPVDSMANDVTISRSVGAPVSPRATDAFHAAIQLADGDAPPPAADTSAGVDSVSAGPAAAPAGGMAGGLSDRDLDEVLRKLYPRLRRSLSSELLVARERAGVLADLR